MDSVPSMFVLFGSPEMSKISPNLRAFHPQEDAREGAEMTKNRATLRSLRTRFLKGMGVGFLNKKWVKLSVLTCFIVMLKEHDICNMYMGMGVGYQQKKA